MHPIRLTHRALLRRKLFILFAIIAITACEHIELTEIEGNTDEQKPTTEIVAPFRTGQGTMEAPYTVTDVLQKGEQLFNKEVWVIGYAVGTAYNGMNNAVFEPQFLHDSNILLASKANCTETSYCVPVKLNKKTLKEGLSLLSHPSMRACQK